MRKPFGILWKSLSKSRIRRNTSLPSPRPKDIELSDLPLTAGQKGRLAELDRVYQGKWAEREIFLKKQLDEAYAAQKADEVEKIQQQLVRERARIDEERDEEKERVRRAK